MQNTPHQQRPTFPASAPPETKCRTVSTLWKWAASTALVGLFLTTSVGSLAGQDGASGQETPVQVAAEEVIVLSQAEIPAEVKQAAGPLFSRVANAERIRATIRMEVVSAVGDQVMGSNQGLFQVASQIPNLLSLSAKFDPDAVRMVSTGDDLFIQLSATEYVQTDAPASLNAFIAAMPLQLGPQPESMLWLSVAGMQPEELLFEGLSQVSVADGEPLEGMATKVITAVRPEGVKWDLRLTAEEAPRPLSLKIDITEMITKANNLQVPENYSFRVLYAFERWEIDPAMDAALFEFSPPESGEKFESLSAYLEKKSAPEQSPLLGQPTPTFTAPSLAGETVELKAEPGEVVVLDFWATWCGPCVEALPELVKLIDEFEGRDVRFHAISISEEKEAVAEFIRSKELQKLPVVLDAEGQLAAAFAISAIPQTVLIGKDGRVEAVHIGVDPDESMELLRNEIETLLAGRKIFQAEPVEEKPAREEATDEATADEETEEVPAQQ